MSHPLAYESRTRRFSDASPMVLWETLVLHSEPRVLGDGPRANILFESNEIDLPSETAISLGFIASELITNDVKHSYPAR